MFKSLIRVIGYNLLWTKIEKMRERERERNKIIMTQLNNLIDKLEFKFLFQT